MIERPSRLVLLGHPVAHSLSPAFQNAALRHASIPLRYDALDVAPSALTSTLDSLVRERAAGNVTIPHKRAVFERCERRTPLAERVGAVNTFWVEDGALVGDNTDVAGFEALLASVLDDARVARNVALIGAGGAAAAVLAALERTGAHVCVWNRNGARARSLAGRFSAVSRAVGTLDDAVRDAALVINATPLGRLGPPWPVEPSALASGAIVLDLSYAPGETAWVRAARAASHPGADGREMLLVQGARAFERWLGVAPDLDVMRQALDRAAMSEAV